MRWVAVRGQEYPLAGLPIKLALGDYSLLSLRRRRREAAFIIPRVVMASDDVGLSPVSFHDYSEYKTPS